MMYLHDVCVTSVDKGMWQIVRYPGDYIDTYMPNDQLYTQALKCSDTANM